LTDWWYYTDFQERKKMVQRQDAFSLSHDDENDDLLFCLLKDHFSNTSRKEHTDSVIFFTSNGRVIA
jgi:hypothetical protein